MDQTSSKVSKKFSYAQLFAGAALAIMVFAPCGARADESLFRILDLGKWVNRLSADGESYQGQDKLSVDQTRALVAGQQLAASTKALEQSQATACADAAAAVKKALPQGEGWEIIMLTRLGTRSNMVGGAANVTPNPLAQARFTADLKVINGMLDAGTLTPDSITSILEATGRDFKHDPEAAMSYVAALGGYLQPGYGDSVAGQFISRFEQYGRIRNDQSVGQCSDIEFAMLKAYKAIAGKGAKAYLVNYQTAGAAHHTNLVIENKGKISIVDYGTISTTERGQSDPLAQNDHASHGLAYRVFTDDGEIDMMVAHIDSPLGKFLREASTGVASHNPFERIDSSAFSATLKKGDGLVLKTFFGELGGGDVVLGVAINLKKVSQLPVGFKLESYLASALSYAHSNFRFDAKKESLHSEIFYLNTGLGAVTPKLKVSGITMSGRSDLVLEGGFWLKQYSAPDDDEMRPYEGDVNFVSRSHVSASGKIFKKVSLNADVELELMPSFKTAFPESADGSSGLKGLPQTLGVLPNRLTAGLTAAYSVTPSTALDVGLLMQFTPLGTLGQASLGMSVHGLRTGGFVRGAFDRSVTPGFVPGATREIGLLSDICRKKKSGADSLCVGLYFDKSLEDGAWTSNLSSEIHF